jgi:hypothetical protein
MIACQNNMLIGIFFAIVWFTVLLLNDVESDYAKIMAHKAINHTKEALVRMLWMLPPTFLLCVPIEGFAALKVIETFGIALALQLAVWWEFFDGLLNRKRDKPWRYNGSIDPDDPKTDTFLHYLTDRQEAHLKWGLIMIFLTLYVIARCTTDSFLLSLVGIW